MNNGGNMSSIQVISRKPNHKILSWDHVEPLQVDVTEFDGYYIGDVISLEFVVRDASLWGGLDLLLFEPGFSRMCDKPNPESKHFKGNFVGLEFTILRRIHRLGWVWKRKQKTGFKESETVIEVEPISDKIEDVFISIYESSRKIRNEEINGGTKGLHENRERTDTKHHDYPKI
jgi:hypothetical protein